MKNKISLKKLSLAFALVGHFFSTGAAHAEPATVAAPLAETYAGRCSIDGTICAHFAPTEMPIHAVAKYLKSAKSSIRIVTYNMDVREFIDILNEKLKQGVKVEFGADYKLSFTTILVWNSLRPQPNLTKYRLPVFRGSNPQMHNKVIIIDNEVVLFGSANFTYSGLVANYENIMAIRRPDVVKKFSDELDELKSHALSACRHFAQPTESCGQGTEKWDPTLEQLLKTGNFAPEALLDTKVCQRLATGWGLLDVRNLPRPHTIDCFRDPKFKQKITSLTEEIAANEKYVDGSPTSTSDAYKRNHSQTGDVEVYFSPEDDVQRVILRELSKSLEKPSDSFALVSTNFITNRYIADNLIELHRAGVRVEVFFDRGRWEDPMFQMQVERLKELKITIFNNTLTGPYGSNHNKMALIGSSKGMSLLNGSANWSGSAMNRNDENLVVVRNAEIAAIYAQEILSQHFVYGFGQDSNSAQFFDLVNFVKAKVPCLEATLSLKPSCTSSKGQTWKPAAQSAAILSVENVPADPEHEQVWAWVSYLENKNTKVKAVPLFTHHVFAGRWLTSIPVTPGAQFKFKYFKVPRGFNPNQQGIPNNAWEYQGGEDRSLTAAPLAVHIIRDIYTWGQK